MCGPASNKDVNKGLLHFSVADLCKLEWTAAVEGSDKAQFWKQIVPDVCKPREKLLKSPNKMGYGDERIDADQVLGRDYQVE